MACRGRQADPSMMAASCRSDQRRAATTPPGARIVPRPDPAHRSDAIAVFLAVDKAVVGHAAIAAVVRAVAIATPWRPAALATCSRVALTFLVFISA